ncbi:MAG: PHP-associated domain-containing protein [Candidatus Woesearchaeota archaeon]|jgi:hypothetical protein
MKIDFHIHTNYSKDSLNSIEKVRKICLKKGILPCITDHNTIKGALAYQKKYGEDSCIVGEEIMTKQGELIGIYLTRFISSNMSVLKTIKEIFSQGGLLIIPHPFDKLRKSKLHYDLNKLKKICPTMFIETYNSRTIFAYDNKKAKDFAMKNKLYFVVGSDAHTLHEIGNSYVILDNFNIKDKNAFLETFKKKNIKIHTNSSSFLVHVFTKLLKYFKMPF